MQQVSLENLVQYVSPQWLHLLKTEERSRSIVLRNGIEKVREKDVAEIVEAVIKEYSHQPFHH